VMTDFLRTSAGSIMRAFVIVFVLEYALCDFDI
jgi:hypothetical protein